MSDGADRIGIVIATHDRIADAKISQELIRNVWGVDPQPVIVHAYNGDPEWYPEPYLEDELVRITNNGHFRGAAELIDAGIAALAARGDIKHAIVLASDVWLLGGRYPAAVLAQMQAEGQRVGVTPWGYLDSNNPLVVGVASDFFIVDLPWAIEHDMFPLDYADFDRRLGEITLYALASRPSLEKLLMVRIQQAVLSTTGRDATLIDDTLAMMRRMSEREPVHPVNAGQSHERRMEWPEIGLVTNHDMARKREILLEAAIAPETGAAIKSLIAGEIPQSPPASGA